MKIWPAILLSLSVVASASAMDRWSALSMIESGDDDRAVGPGGEVSRFQIRRELWPGGDPRGLNAGRPVRRAGDHAGAAGRFSEKPQTRGDGF
jgi:hypothetical protein